MSKILNINELDTFLFGQLELYKIQFSETNDNKYLEVMNDLNKAITTFRALYNTVDKLNKELTIIKNK